MGFQCLIAFIIIITASFTSAQVFSCLDGCECYEEKFTIANCSQLNLKKVPVNSNGYPVYYFDLSANSISQIIFLDWEGYSTVETLNLTRNNIEHIPESAFEKLMSLQYLYLSDNKISAISPMAFIWHENLTKIFLKNNPLVVPDGGFLHSLSMTYLDLSYSNITYLPTDSFEYLPQLESLRLDGNPISGISHELFENLKNLKEVFMEGEPASCLKSTFNDSLKYFASHNITYYGPPLCSNRFLITSTTFPSAVSENETVLIETTSYYHTSTVESVATVLIEFTTLFPESPSANTNETEEKDATTISKISEPEKFIATNESTAEPTHSENKNSDTEPEKDSGAKIPVACTVLIFICVLFLLL